MIEVRIAHLAPRRRSKNGPPPSTSGDLLRLSVFLFFSFFTFFLSPSLFLFLFLLLLYEHDQCVSEAPFDAGPAALGKVPAVSIDPRSGTCMHI